MSEMNDMNEMNNTKETRPYVRHMPLDEAFATRRLLSRDDIKFIIENTTNKPKLSQIDLAYKFAVSVKTIQRVQLGFSYVTMVEDIKKEIANEKALNQIKHNFDVV